MPAKTPRVQVATKRIRVMGPDALSHAGSANPDMLRDIETEIEEVVATIDWCDLEGQISDQLPEGYYAKIED